LFSKKYHRPRSRKFCSFKTFFPISRYHHFACTIAFKTTFLLFSDHVEPKSLNHSIDHESTREPRSRRSIDSDEEFVSGPFRVRRSVSHEFFVELMVVADRSMAMYHGNSLEEYILSLMYIVSLHKP